MKIINIRSYAYEQIKPTEQIENAKKTKKLRGFSPQANHTDRATAAYRRS
jgi:hypothetical protein